MLSKNSPHGRTLRICNSVNQPICEFLFYFPLLFYCSIHSIISTAGYSFALENVV
uniref:Uncharacterized protein n=1 Tax=Solanum tuberosum TaxID=4113 RepID=M1A1R2_SOLTU